MQEEENCYHRKGDAVQEIWIKHRKGDAVILRPEAESSVSKLVVLIIDKASSSNFSRPSSSTVRYLYILL